MTLSTIISIILCIAIGALTAWGTYKATNGNIYKEVVFLIEEANKLDLIGPEKMNRVIDILLDKVPAPFKNFLTEEKLREIAQNTYDNMKEFSKTEKK